METQKVVIEVFSDILCVWAYGAQTHIDRLKCEFGDRISLQYRFIPLFASTDMRVVQGWNDRGGAAGFNAHTQKIASAWSHVAVHQDLWVKNRPASSTPAHTYLKAVQLLMEDEEAISVSGSFSAGTSLFEKLIWRIRCKFFEDNNNISERGTLDDAARALALPLDKIHDLLENGEAEAALHLDTVARDDYLIPGSPTLVLNEGRQRLYGNVSYRIIEANVHELMTDTQSDNASWC